MDKLNRQPRRNKFFFGSELWPRQVIFFAALFLLWEGLARLGLWPEYLFPPPSSVLAALFAGLKNGTILIGVVGSLSRLLKGYLIATVLGIGIGLLMAQVRWAKDTFGLLLLGLQTLPSICWLPLALLWFGLNETAILFVVIMGAVLAIAQSTEDGIRNTAPIYARAGRNLGAKGVRLYVLVVFPAALPSFISGMKLGWSFAWRSLMAGELLYSLPGLGNLLMMGRELNDMSQVIAVIFVIVVLGVLSDKLFFGKLEQEARERWGLNR